MAIFYVNECMAREALTDCIKALEIMDPEPNINVFPWRLEILGWPEMKSQLESDLVASDIVVVCASDHSSGNWKEFLRLAERLPFSLDGTRRTFIAFQSPRQRNGPQEKRFLNSLRCLARNHDMDFLQGSWSGIQAERSDSITRENGRTKSGKDKYSLRLQRRICFPTIRSSSGMRQRHALQRIQPLGRVSIGIEC